MSGAGRPSLEDEVKYRLRPGRAADWPEAWRLPAGYVLRAAGGWSAEEVYLDSPALDLLRRGAACRLRLLPGQVLAALKTQGQVSGARHRRQELELPLPGPRLDPAGWPAELREALAELLAAPDSGRPALPRRLRPLAALGHQRRLWDVVAVAGTEVAARGGSEGESGVASVDGADIEVGADGSAAAGTATAGGSVLAQLAIDRVWLRAPRRRGLLAGAGQPLALVEELELERGAADAKAWRALRKALDRAPGLGPQKRNKLERALRAAAEARPDEAPPGGRRATLAPAGAVGTAEAGEAAEAAVEAPPGLHPDLPAGPAVRLILRRPLLDLALAEAALRPHAGVEAVHRCRVAARRLAGLLRLFRPLLPRSLGRGRVWLALRDLRRDLGAVRDRDIALEQLAAWTRADGAGDATPHPDLAAALARLEAAWAAERQAAAVALLARLDGPAQGRLYRRLRRWTDLDRTAAAARPGERSLGSRLPEVLAPRLAALAEGLAALDADEAEAGGLLETPAATLHELRIRGKGLRDALRPFRPFLPPAAAQDLAALEAAVDHLGLLQDGAASGLLLQEAGLPAEVLAPLLAALAADDRRLRAELSPHLDALRDPGRAARLLEAWT